MPAWVPAAIGAGGALLGGIMGSKGAKAQARQAQRASDQAAQARQTALKQLSPEMLHQIAGMFFPGLFPTPPPTRPRMNVNSRSQGLMGPGSLINMKSLQGLPYPGSSEAPTGPPRASMGPTVGGPSFDATRTPRPTIDKSQGLIPRQQGGPVQPGQNYLVGEKGPEVLNVMPQQTQAPVGNITPIGQPAPETPTPLPGVGGAVPATPGLPMGPTQQPMPATPTAQPSMGSLAVSQSQGLLEQPGKFSPAYYERQQEQANIGLNQARSAIPGDLAGSGIDPNSPMGQLLMQSAVLNSQQQRSQAAREQSLLEEAQRREDIQSGITNYLAFLNSIFGLGTQRAAAAVGGGFPQTQVTPSAAGALGTGISTAATGLARYFQNNPGAQTQTTPSTVTPGASGRVTL